MHLHYNPVHVMQIAWHTGQVSQDDGSGNPGCWASVSIFGIYCKVTNAADTIA